MGGIISTIILWSGYIVSVIAIGIASLLFFPFTVSLFNALVLGFIVYLILVILFNPPSSTENIILGLIATLGFILIYVFYMIKQL